MLNAVIIEDEQKNINLLQNMLKANCSESVTITGSATNITDAIELINNVHPHLVYLDIELNDGNAFDLLAELGNKNLQVIFITAFNEYAVKAFRLNAVDYLLKPISAAELKEATDKATQKINSAAGNIDILKILKQFTTSASNSKLAVAVTDGLLYFDYDEIIRIEAKSNYSILFLKNGKSITCIKTMKEIEKMLPENHFLRVHHSWIINLDYIKKYYRNKNGYIEMTDGSTVAISTRKKNRLMSIFNKA
jgi:two-component system, LytTR family, response regulator